MHLKEANVNLSQVARKMLPFPSRIVPQTAVSTEQRFLTTEQLRRISANLKKMATKSYFLKLHKIFQRHATKTIQINSMLQETSHQSKQKDTSNMMHAVIVSLYSSVLSSLLFVSRTLLRKSVKSNRS